MKFNFKKWLKEFGWCDDERGGDPDSDKLIIVDGNEFTLHFEHDGIIIQITNYGDYWSAIPTPKSPLECEYLMYFIGCQKHLPTFTSHENYIHDKRNGI